MALFFSVYMCVTLICAFIACSFLFRMMRNRAEMRSWLAEHRARRVYVFVNDLKAPVLDAPVTTIHRLCEAGIPCELNLNGPSRIRIVVFDGEMQ